MVLLLEYAVFGVLVAANLSVGLYFSFRKRGSSTGGGTTKDEIFLGNRALGILPLAASSVASVYSSPALVAFPAHFYAYGWHTALCALTPLLCLPLATQVIVPMLHGLQITSVFEYIRWRFNRAISLTACVIYIFLTQSIGAISILAASVMLVTVFNAPLLWCNIAIGLSGTIYTALGGLRGVVWTDCMQFIIILVAPTALFAKIMVDSLSANSTVQPLSDLDVGMYIGDFRFDLTSDETVWSCVVGATTFAIYRLCLDQMVVQRMMACASVKQAQRTVLSGALLLTLPYTSCTLLGIAITIWYRGCDPGLSGAIKRIDQILPYYINTELVNIPGFAGLFLAGVVSAATSTISSAINSQAAILYIDVISQGYKRADEHVLMITRTSAVILGVIMTAYSSLVVHMGSLTRILLMVNAAVTAPFVGLCILAVLFPFVHCKGAGVATLLMLGYQLWHMAETLKRGTRAARIPVSLDYCPANYNSTFSPLNTTSTVPNLESEETFFIFRLSYLWSGFFALIGTILIAVFISAVTGEFKNKKEKKLCNDALVRLWQKIKSYASKEQPHIQIYSYEENCLCKPEGESLVMHEWPASTEKKLPTSSPNSRLLAV
ncbi:sodium-coupled monocarboxylate transporter 1-like [Dermacentor silvarum]|uniref:sodium-coupled monocarboxylate transporter 1-like n=1 Tax=Dermacentor silvarum TaxID=543639 RepID=UPI002100CFEE|nr:sodium-coupled monocarboxylate transporter 1-like [Dermacentor silvarum]